MRRRLLASTLTIVVAILVLFGVPLGIVVDRAVHADAQSRLESEATRVARELGQPDAPAPTPEILDRRERYVCPEMLGRLYAAIWRGELAATTSV